MKDQTSQRHTPPKELIDHSTERTTKFVAKLKKAMREIEQDIATNDGLYPYNAGRLSQAEVCRRAGVLNRSLQGKKHKDTTRVDVETWRKRVLAGILCGTKNVRRAVTERADTWKADAVKAAQAQHITQLRLDGELERNRKLNEENEALRAQMRKASNSRVLLLPKK